MRVICINFDILSSSLVNDQVLFAIFCFIIHFIDYFTLQSFISLKILLHFEYPLFNLLEFLLFGLIQLFSSAVQEV